MKNLYIEATDKTPEIKFNANTGYLKFVGRMHPENVDAFMADIKVWLEEYLKNPQEKTVFEINLEYINSSSLKSLLYNFSKFRNVETQVELIWYYYDEDSKEQGLELNDVLKGKIIFKEA